MATAAKVSLKDITPSGNFANIFASFQLPAGGLVPQPVAAIDRWYYIENPLNNYTKLCIQFSGIIDRNVAVTLYRSTGVNTDNTDYAIPVPGGTDTMTPDVPGTLQRISIDFNIENVYYDRLWFKLTAAAAFSGAIDTVNVDLKA